MLRRGTAASIDANTMQVRQFIRPDIAVSAIAHLSALALVVLFTEVHPFGSVTAEPIAVDLVTSDEIAKQPDPTPTPTPQFSLPDLKSSTEPETPNAASHHGAIRDRHFAAFRASRARHCAFDRRPHRRFAGDRLRQRNGYPQPRRDRLRRLGEIRAR